ncbi:hypothetical protein [Specibacter cremeus]|uniref:hypothetical protein n=1 Tax=Specibacter cremeus TaxID=1629051 RepID=UPI0030B82340
MTVLLAVIGVLGVSASGPIMAATAAPAPTIAFWRHALGALVMGVPAVTRNRHQFRGLDGRQWGWTLLAAATALVCLQAAWIALFQWLRGTRPRPALVIGLGVALIGVVVITGLDVGTSGEALLGDALALAGGVLAAIYTLAGAKVRRTLSTGVYTTLCYGICALILVALCLALQNPSWPCPRAPGSASWA